MDPVFRNLTVIFLGVFAFSGRGEANAISSLIKGLQKIIGKSDDSLIKRGTTRSQDDLERNVKDLPPLPKESQTSPDDSFHLKQPDPRVNINPKILTVTDLQSAAGRVRQKLEGRARADIYTKIGTRIFTRNDVLFENFVPLDDLPPPPSSKRRVSYLNSGLPRIRNQGSDISCTAFAVLGAMEMLAIRKYGRRVDLSESSLWNAQGLYPNFEISILTAATIPVNLEIFDPYWAPGGIQGGDSKKFSHGMLLSLRGASHLTKYVEIADALEQGDAVIMAVNKTSFSLMNAKDASAIGVDQVQGPYGHAMSLLSISIDPSFPGGGYFVVRNSWGTSWGAGGYGVINFDYCRVTGCQFTKFSELIFFSQKDNYYSGGDNLREIFAVASNISKPFREYLEKLFRLIADGKNPDPQKIARSRVDWKKEDSWFILKEFLPDHVSDESYGFLGETIQSLSH